ncbi:MAG: hypothetical protein L7H10_02125 [Vulcanisaeta sp.]|jgi:RNase P/RNase MRP subunit POP5|nr:hypothetical protein [Vulcanisaeta sp.]MCG2869529.1 hypothetical protein [Vulcanisaeta sp.]MCG2886743.1 hypothetical protein [Vulcanisaeta sp.]
MRYLIIDVYPKDRVDDVLTQLNNLFKSLAGKEAIGVELRVVKKYEGRVVIGVPNHLTKYLRSAIALAGRGSDTAVITVKVSGTMRKALAIASSVQYLFNEFQG